MELIPELKPIWDALDYLPLDDHIRQIGTERCILLHTKDNKFSIWLEVEQRSPSLLLYVVTIGDHNRAKLHYAEHKYSLVDDAIRRIKKTINQLRKYGDFGI